MMSGNAPTLWVGQRVAINKLGAGNVMYVGEPHFAPGQWIGIILDLPNGKNDGSVQGQTYIHDCPPQHGVFVRPSQVHLLPQPDSSAASIMDEEAEEDDLADRSLSPRSTIDPPVRSPVRVEATSTARTPTAATAPLRATARGPTMVCISPQLVFGHRRLAY